MLKKTIGKNINGGADNHNEICPDSNCCDRTITHSNMNKYIERRSLLDKLPDDERREAILKRKLKLEALKKTLEESNLGTKLIHQRVSDDLDITLKNLLPSNFRNNTTLQRSISAPLVMTDLDDRPKGRSSIDRNRIDEECANKSLNTLDMSKEEK